jgi:NAD-dependent deacetylase
MEHNENPDGMTTAVQQIAEHLAAGGRNIVFTGAGISTESGIPDYRSKGGIWDRFRPVYFDEFMASEAARVEYWRRKAELYPNLIAALPNPAHLALTQLYELGLLDAVITQNIDGLHQKAGLPAEKVIELHGNTLRVRCLRCGAVTSLHEAHQRITAGELAPVCPCGGYLKPDTISFGQAMPLEEMQQAVELAQTCDLFLVIGSTLLVQPAALLPQYARQQGAFLGIITLSDTPYDAVGDVVIHARAGTIMPQIMQALLRLRS